MKGKIKFIIFGIVLIYVGYKKNIFYRPEIQLSNDSYDSIISISKNRKILKKGKIYFYQNSDEIMEVPYKNVKTLSERYLEVTDENEDRRVLDLEKNNFVSLEFSEILGLIDEKYLLVEDDGKQFYYNLLEEKEVGKRYERVGVLSENKAVFIKDNKVGFIDGEGKEVIKNRFEAAGDFENGYAVVITSPYGRYKYIDQNGVESEKEYDYIKAFKKDVLLLRDKEVNILINKGKEIKTKDKIIPLNDDFYLFKNLDTNIGQIFSIKSNGIIKRFSGEYVCSIDDEVVIREKNSYYIYSLETKEIKKIKNDFDELEIYRKDYAIGRKNEKAYIYDENYKKISKGFDIIYPKAWNLFIVGEETGYGVIDENAKEILQAKYDSIQLIPKYIIAELDGKKMIFNSRGKNILLQEYDEIVYINGDVYVRESNHKWRTIIENKKRS